jgi:tetratricopeptide (TPR) repeat protein
MKPLLIPLLLLIPLHAFALANFEKEAEKLYDDGQYQSAVETLSKDAEKLSEKGYLILAASYSELKEYDNELRILNNLAAKDEKNYRWTMLIAQSHLKKSRAAKDEALKKTEETSAIQNFRTTIKHNPKFKPAYDQLLEIFDEKKETHEAIEVLMQGLKQFGDLPQWLSQLCQMQANDGFLSQAESTCERAIRRSPKYPDNYVFLSQSLLDQNEPNKAEKVARLSGARFPDSEFAQWGAGKVYLILKNYEAAQKFFGNAIHNNAKSMRAHLGMAEALFQSGDRSHALGHYQKACELGAKNSEDIHVLAAETRMKGDEGLSAKYRNLAENCR